LQFSDYIYVLEKGAVEMEGTFDEIKGSELHVKFQELEEVKKDLSHLIS